MKNEIEAMITDITTTTAEAEDYTGEDGLLYCGKCHTPKEAYFAEGKTCFGRDRHPTDCDCQRAAREKLLDRSTLSQKNGWQDSEGRTYIVYPIAEIAEMLDKGCTTIKGALNELDAAGLLERRRTGFSAANRLYVKVPPIPVVQFSDQLTDGKPTLIRAGNRPTDSRKTDLMTVGKPSPNQTNINNLIESQTKRASEGQPPAAYGRYKNVFLSDAELLELEQDFPGKWEYYLDRLSCHIASTGKQYQSHAATIYKWAQEDAAKGKAAPKQGIPDYSCKEGESL